MATPRKLRQETEISWPTWDKILNPAFIPIMNDDSKYIVMYGGRSSSKSYSAAVKCVYLMMRPEHCKILMIRKTQATIKDSCYNMIISVIERLGFQDLFQWKETPNPEIRCIATGNMTLARGLDKPGRIKSLNDLSLIWYEEEFPDLESDWITINTTLRTKKAPYLQIICSINPEVYSGAYQDNWFWKRFFSQNPDEKSFRTEAAIEINGKTIVEKTFCHHSTYHDNPHIDDSTRATYELLRTQAPDKYITYVLGLWGNKERTGLYYSRFNRAGNTISTRPYDPTKPIHLSVDENVVPYMAGSIFQFDDLPDSPTGITSVYAIDEITTQKYHSVENLCAEFKKKFPFHDGGLFVYGDVSLKRRSTLLEEGWNGYRIIQSELAQYNPILRVPQSNPNLNLRADFINAMFAGGIEGVNYKIAEKCKVLIRDLQDVQVNKDGGKLKKVVKRNGETFQEIAHMSDSQDYFLMYVFQNELYKYVNGNLQFKPKFGKQPFNKKHSY